MSKAKSPGDRHAGAGLSLASPAARPDDVSEGKPKQSVASRAVQLSSYFLSGALAINLSQFLGTPLYMINQDWYNAWIAFTKQSFGLLTMSLTQMFSPTKVIVSGDESVRDGTLLLDFPERIVLIANHQIYTDWLYLWWTAYCSGMHGRLYIILKESLKNIPIIGWGMQFNQFIFLKRNWEQDRGHMAQALQRLNKLTDPMWLLIFPEGTNLAPSTRQKSAQWAAKNNMKDMRHTLLPRSTGLRFCLQELKGTVGYLYDCTIAYEGVPRGAFAQDIFTLKAGYLEGKPPKSVSMYWRRFAVKDIPLHSEKAFELWLLARWREKDLLIENYLIHGRFPGDTGVSKTASGAVKRGAGHLNVEIKSSHWYEFLQIFAPMGVLAMVLYCFYGALPQKFFKSESGKALKDSADDIKTMASSARSVKPPSMPSFSLDMIFDKDKQAQTFGKAGQALAQFVQSPEAQSMMNRADLVQQWLQDPQKLLIESMSGTTDKENFLKSMKEEENRRKKHTNKHQGSFWQDFENAESRPVRAVAGKAKDGTFYNRLQKARAQKTASALTERNLKSKSNFWDDLEKETSRRAGSVFTLPTISSEASRTAINSMDSGSTAVGSGAATSKPPKLPKQGPSKLSTTTSSKDQPTVKSAPTVKKPASGSAVNKPAPKSKQSSTKTAPATKAQPKTNTTPSAKPVSKPLSKPAAPAASKNNTVKKNPPKLQPPKLPAVSSKPVTKAT
ncbi:hypothetical protein LTR70_002305 [Exophiala xenobiotica]|uniref:Phospholipid/glycerol acyltransferase domain-containing protein n=1 Tax=Lithohypha guttulata TaxID=1690604 RepID=A0ABR0KL33_9EURO|nr:hypothetical protein LTR24_001273 [Lithohypha guttulata]KAK5326040.1 hypothetical protein LTR70_002305 [Exophiala xenobiotica]